MELCWANLELSWVPTHPLGVPQLIISQPWVQMKTVQPSGWMHVEWYECSELICLMCAGPGFTAQPHKKICVILCCFFFQDMEKNHTIWVWLCAAILDLPQNPQWSSPTQQPCPNKLCTSRVSSFSLLALLPHAYPSSCLWLPPISQHRPHNRTQSHLPI